MHYGICSVIILFTVSITKPSRSSYYIAAVFEHLAVGDQEEPLSKIIFKNLLVYKRVTSIAAKNGADVIVFPEYGLYPFVTREKFRIVAQYVPDPRRIHWNPCTDPSRDKNISIVKDLSCMAKQYNIYLAANLVTVLNCNKTKSVCPPDGIFLYNTNVIFDRKGKLVARYRKYHLYQETGIDAPQLPDFVTFNTDFGTVGTFICYDLEWMQSVELVEKYKIDTIIYTAWWGGELPALTSIQRYFSWSAKFNVNMLASNKHNPSRGILGSGIFRGAYSSSQYVYNPDGKSKLILAKIPLSRERSFINDSFTVFSFGSNHTGNNLTSGVCSTKILGPPKSKFDYRCNEEDLTNYTLIKLEKSSERITACNNGLCCHLYYKLRNFHGEDYYFVVRNATFKLEAYPISVEICMVTRCDPFEGKRCSVFPTKAITVFGELSMKANFTTKYVYPNILTSGVQLLNVDKWVFNNFSLSLKEAMNEPMLTAVLFGRCYNRDPHSFS